MGPGIYACHRCGEVGVKLWREAHSMSVLLTCVNCLEAIEAGGDHAFDVGDIAEDGTRMGEYGLTDQIGWWLPAVLVQADLPHLHYWGYTSSSPEDYAAWLDLPLHPEVEEVPFRSDGSFGLPTEGTLVIRRMPTGDGDDV